MVTTSVFNQAHPCKLLLLGSYAMANVGSSFHETKSVDINVILDRVLEGMESMRCPFKQRQEVEEKACNSLLLLTNSKTQANVNQN